MRKSITIRIICLTIAGSVLMGALAVSAINGSPYEVLKNAFFGIVFEENITVEGVFTVHLNGELTMEDRGRDITTENTSLFFDDNGWRFFLYDAPGVILRSSVTTVDGVQWYYAEVTHSIRRGGVDFFGLSTPEGRHSNSIRFAELLVDLVVGDLRNNITMSNKENGIRRVSGTVTENQLPEIVRVFIDMVVEEGFNHGGLFQDIVYPIQSVSIDKIYGTGDVDANGYLLYLNAGIILTIVDGNGNSNILHPSMVMRFSDIGTSSADSPIPGALELFTSDFMRYNFGRPYGSVYFTLTPDRSINPDSVTTTWPGQIYELQ